jgi:hypothetical protein
MTDQPKHEMTDAIEASLHEVEKGMSGTVRPLVRPEHRTQQAMTSVDRQSEQDDLAVEAFVDQALHARIMAVRGKYQPGPRDSYVRRTVLRAIASITDSNAHAL